jgi:hypothetical protein
MGNKDKAVEFGRKAVEAADSPGMKRYIKQRFAQKFRVAGREEKPSPLTRLSQEDPLPAPRPRRRGQVSARPAAHRSRRGRDQEGRDFQESTNQPLAISDNLSKIIGKSELLSRMRSIARDVLWCRPPECPGMQWCWQLSWRVQG